MGGFGLFMEEQKGEELWRNVLRSVSELPLRCRNICKVARKKSNGQHTAIPQCCSESIGLENNQITLNHRCPRSSQNLPSIPHQHATVPSQGLRTVVHVIRDLIEPQLCPL